MKEGMKKGKKPGEGEKGEKEGQKPGEKGKPGKEGSSGEKGKNGVVLITTKAAYNKEMNSSVKELKSTKINNLSTANINANLSIIIEKHQNALFVINNKERTFKDAQSISHINLKSKKVTISNQHLLSLKISIKLNEKITVLNEFTLEKPRSIFYVDPTITTYNGPLVNAKTLGLPFANTKPKVNNAIVKLSSGAVVSIDNLINSLNGNKRRKRIVEKLANEDRRLVKIRKYFTDDFFITTLQIKKENINPFLNFCIKEKIIQVFNDKENIKLTNILVKQSKLFPQKEMSDIKVAYKKN